ncbi:MAG: hypothetical protein Q8R20_00850 [Nanoarchaeota archaeon]|nr:hypothetical protein [Nanoarchaeota archaeon]
MICGKKKEATRRAGEKKYEKDRKDEEKIRRNPIERKEMNGLEPEHREKEKKSREKIDEK